MFLPEIASGLLVGVSFILFPTLKHLTNFPRPVASFANRRFLSASVTVVDNESEMVKAHLKRRSSVGISSVAEQRKSYSHGLLVGLDVTCY